MSRLAPSGRSVVSHQFLQNLYCTRPMKAELHLTRMLMRTTLRGIFIVFFGDDHQNQEAPEYPVISPISLLVALWKVSVAALAAGGAKTFI